MEVDRYYIQTFPEFIDKLNHFSDKELNNEVEGEKDRRRKPYSLWYRGEKKLDFKLQPSAYRYGSFCKDSPALESRSIACAQSAMFHVPETKYLQYDIDWLCYMQHYGIPTRLMDWTYDLSPALYFAFEDYLVNENVMENQFPSIWVLKIEKFIGEMRNFIQKAPIYKTSQLIKFFDHEQPIHVREIDDKMISKLTKELLDQIYLPFYSPFVNERVKLQGGCFIRFPLKPSTVFSKETQTALDVFLTLQNIESCLAQFIFAKPRQLCHELSILNLETSRYYPEIERIAKRIKALLFPH